MKKSYRPIIDAQVIFIQRDSFRQVSGFHKIE